MLNYGVDFEKMGAAFTKFVEKNYLSVHKSFVDLKGMFFVELYAEYGKTLDIMFKDYFGIRIKTESEWVKSVSNL
jgi:hypothetical protein